MKEVQQTEAQGERMNIRNTRSSQAWKAVNQKLERDGGFKKKLSIKQIIIDKMNCTQKTGPDGLRQPPSRAEEKWYQSLLLCGTNEKV